jgi:YidC/Oxa1 family membrane protein insertase
MYASITTPIGKIFQPLLHAVGDVLAFFYSVIPNYPIDVALLTIAIMALLTPLTVKSTKNMAAMQALGPEMKKLQQKYKGPENRTQLNEEMMKLYKEHKVNPASGCLPMLLQMPAFFILYSVIRGITNTVTTPTYHVNLAGHKVQVGETVTAVPRYIPHNSAMYINIYNHHGQLISFGMDFSDKLLSHHSSIFVAIPFLLLVVASVGLQYLQMSRLNKRNGGAAQANPQAAMLQKYMPLIFGFIYINVAAILNVYFIVSSAIRILTQEILFRKGMVGVPPAPVLDATATETKKPKGPVADRTERALPKPRAAGTSGSAKPRAAAKPGATAANGKSSNGKSGRPAPAAKAEIDAAAVVKRQSSTNGSNGSNGKKAPSSSNGNGSRRGPAKPSGNGSNGSSGSGSSSTGATTPKEHPRSKAKRERKAR